MKSAVPARRAGSGRRWPQRWWTWLSPAGLSSFYSELMKGLGAGGRLWELLERKPELPFNGESAHMFFREGWGKDPQQLSSLSYLEEGRDGRQEGRGGAAGGPRGVPGSTG